jgi:hypothetical protein
MTMGNDALLPEVYGAEGNHFVLDYNQTVDLVLWNTDGGMHPCKPSLLFRTSTDRCG